MDPRRLREFKEDLLKRSQQPLEESSDDGSAFEEFFRPNEVEKRQQYPNIPGRKPGDDVIYKKISVQDPPPYARHIKRQSTNDITHAQINPEAFQTKYKATIVPEHLKNSRRIDKAKSRYGLDGSIHLFQHTGEPQTKPAEMRTEGLLSSPLKESEPEVIQQEASTVKLQVEQPIDSLEKESLLAEIDQLKEGILDANAKVLHLQKQNLKLTSERQRHLEKYRLLEKKFSKSRQQQAKGADLVKKISALEKKVKEKHSLEDKNEQLKLRLIESEAKHQALKASMKQLLLSFQHQDSL